jgi:hypothetical protein
MHIDPQRLKLKKKCDKNNEGSKWTNISDKHPEYGEPVLIKTNSGVTQNVTYTRDGCDDHEDWFEPYHFDHDDDLKIPISKVKAWRELPT